MIFESVIFNGCTKLKEVKGAGGITFISSCCFQGCSSLSSFDGSTITEISSSGFKNCVSFRNLECFRSLLKIGDAAFWGCTNLEFDIIDFLEKSKITVVGGSAFANDTRLTGTWEGSILNSDRHEISIGANVFSGTGVTMTKILNFEGITKINDYQFAGATELNDKNGKPVTNIEIPENITEIGEAAFSGCVGIETVIIKGAITSLGANCFSGCQALTEVSFENKDCIFEKIPDYCFDTCKNLKDFTLPSSVKNIGIASFSGTSIASIDLSNIVKLESSCFADCSNLTSIVKLSEQLTALPYACFVRSGIKGTIEIPSSVKSAAEYVFGSCKNLERLEIKGELSYIPMYFCSSCMNLESVTFERSVKNIGGEAFRDCTLLSDFSVDWGKIDIIGDYAFRNCSKLKNEVHLNANCQFDFDKAFENCGLILR